MKLRTALYMMSVASMMIFSSVQAIDGQINSESLKHCSSSHHHHHVGPRGATGAIGATGATGVTGPTGPAFTFLPDLGQTLEFLATGNITGLTGGTATIQPFVQQPDQSIVLGNPILLPDGFSGAVIPISIIIPNPEFGLYRFGLAISVASGATIVPGNVNVLVNSSRFGVIGLSSGLLGPLGPPLTQAQVGLSLYTYGLNLP